MNQKNHIRLEITSTAFDGEDGEKSFAACRAAAAKCGFEFGIQLHNSSLQNDIDKMVALGAPLSAHAPLLSENGINLGAQDFEPAKQIFADNMRIFAELGVREAVFHGFGMTDKPIPGFNRERPYDTAMSKIFRPELSLDGSSRMCCDFTHTDEYRERIARVKKRLAWLRSSCPCLWCIENDFPAYGSANMFSENAAWLEHPICLDSGHLWAVSHLFDRNFHDETERFLTDCDVRMVHLHASKFTAAAPKRDWGDGHLPLNTPNKMNLPRFVRNCHRAGVNFFVLEIRTPGPEDIYTFADMLTD